MLCCGQLLVFRQLPVAGIAIAWGALQLLSLWQRVGRFDQVCWVQGLLSDWNDTTDPCLDNWTGVDCTCIQVRLASIPSCKCMNCSCKARQAC